MIKQYTTPRIRAVATVTAFMYGPYYRHHQLVHTHKVLTDPDLRTFIRRLRATAMGGRR